MKKVIALLLLLIGLLQYRLWFGDGNVLEFRRLNDRIEELRQEGAKRRERNAALEAEVMDLKQGLDAVEERARQDLGMIKEGEVFVQVIDPRHEPDARPTTLPGKSGTAPAKSESGKVTREEKPHLRKTHEADTPRSTESTTASRIDKPKAATAVKRPVRRSALRQPPNKPRPWATPAQTEERTPESVPGEPPPVETDQ